MIRLEDDEDGCTAHIEGEMTIYNAMGLKDELLSLLDDARSLEINLAKVSEMDSAGVQLLMMIKRECCTRGRGLALIDHSDDVVDVFEMMDLVPFFNDPVVLSGK